MKRPDVTVPYAEFERMKNRIKLLEGLEKTENEELTKMRAELDQASDWRMDIRKQVEQADAVSKGWKAKADALEVENNSLRAQLHEALLNAERMRGYLDGVEDSQPPAMVPAQRERRFGRYTGQGSEETGYTATLGRDGTSYQRQKRWFER